MMFFAQSRTQYLRLAEQEIILPPSFVAKSIFNNLTARNKIDSAPVHFRDRLGISQAIISSYLFIR